jgi:hypothetical protein
MNYPPLFTWEVWGVVWRTHPPTMKRILMPTRGSHFFLRTRVDFFYPQNLPNGTETKEGKVERSVFQMTVRK